MEVDGTKEIMDTFNYTWFLDTPSKSHWNRVGLRRRAGVCVPLFSIWSKQSAGIGEIPDVRGIVDWCVASGLSLIQLLPLNDMGYDIAPYSAKSSFALDPVYLSLRSLVGVDLAPFEPDLRGLAASFPIGERVNYAVKGAKMALLWKMFVKRDRPEDARFQAFRRRTAFWLRDDALYKILKDRHQGDPWERWPDAYRKRSAPALDALAEEEKESIRFHEWVQWQLYEQMVAVKAYAKSRGVVLMGDMPFLVARDSADVWAHAGYFQLHLSAGAPPDLYFAGGQRWGMPAYDWPAMARRDYDYLERKLGYAGHFYDLYRIDHVIGVFRLYTIPVDSPPERAALDGAFLPKDERVWEKHGRKLLETMLEGSSMMPCGEDLGVVPACSYKVLKELAIPGLEVQRWIRDWGKTNAFLPPDQYRPHSVAVCSTHDMSIVAGWWKHEVATVDGYFIRLQCEQRGLAYEDIKAKLFDSSAEAHGRLHWKRELDTDAALLGALDVPEEHKAFFLDLFRSTRWERELFWKFLGMEGPLDPEPTPALVLRALEKAGESSSIFSVQLLQDWLYAGGALEERDPWSARINLPGSVGAHNWSTVCPLPVEDLADWPGNAAMLDVNKRTGRS